MEARTKLWIEERGRLVMSDYRVRLLELIVDSGSLARAAQSLSLSYRRAWGKVRELEQNLGISLIRSEAGGPGGGRSTLTPAGEALVSAYRQFHTRVERDTREAFEEILLPVLSASSRDVERPSP
ncbi:MAG: winged helix-turn-helix domain-containing protein [Dehalococcoidia bacterium]